jgi:diguanylate cyclase (GGDEF)-like protein
MAAPLNPVQMSAAIRAANEAILSARNTLEMLQRVCDVAVRGNTMLGAVVFLPETASSWLNAVASAGELAHIFAKADPSSDPTIPEGQGLVGQAFVTGEPCICEDAPSDRRIQPWRRLAESASLGTAAAFPIVCKGQPVGVISYFFSQESGALGVEMIEFLSRIADIASLGMEIAEREERRRFEEESKNRTAQMLAALSATNEAMMRATTRAQLFEQVCEAAVLGGNFASTTILLAEPDSEFLRVEAAAGPDAERARSVQLSVDASRPEGQGLSGSAFRSKQPCISNDFLADSKMSHLHARAREGCVLAGAALPLLNDGETIGVLLFLSKELGAFTPELVALLQRLAANISFALKNFDRAAERKQAEDRMEYLATHDGLTGLPNRAMFNHLLNASIRVGRRYERKFALMFVDLDRFKEINDTLGHAAGDALLVEVSRRLRGCLRDSDVVARLGGDEFVIILNDVVESHRVAKVARHVVDAIRKPLLLSGRDCGVTASVGISLFPEDGEDEETLTKHADIAMYTAKQAGKDDFRFFSSEIKSQSAERLKLETNLRQAVGGDEFFLHYQPKQDMATGHIAGVEALLRWNHPELGELPPLDFIPLAEETGLIIPIGRWVLKTACAQSMEWQRRGLAPVSMAVNLSPRQFADGNLLRDIDNALADSGLAPHLLQLEISESTVMLNVGRAVEMLDAIQGRGVRLAIDDFGMGYSSMSLMTRFPIDTIKIDRSFMRDLPRRAEDKGIAEAIIGMGRALGLTVIAEGVETSDQETFLRKHACDQLQGFLFSKAVSPEDLAALLHSEAAISSPALQPPDAEAPLQIDADATVRSAHAA